MTDFETIQSIWNSKPHSFSSLSGVQDKQPATKQIYTNSILNCKAPIFEPNMNISFTDNNTTTDELSDCSISIENSKRFSEQSMNSNILLPNLMGSNSNLSSRSQPCLQLQKHLCTQLVSELAIQQNQESLKKPQIPYKQEKMGQKRCLKYRPDKQFGLKELELVQRNSKEEKIQEICSDNAAYYVIKSFNDLDIFYGIKYGIWCTTKSGNRKLNEAYVESKKQYPIYLIFNIQGSSEFQGIAQMTSPVDFNTYFDGWSINKKWIGLFAIQWIFIKEIPTSLCITPALDITTIIQIQNTNDIQQLPTNFGEEFVKIFQKSNQTSKHLDSVIQQMENSEQNQNNILTSQNNFKIQGTQFGFNKAIQPRKPLKKIAGLNYWQQNSQQQQFQSQQSQFRLSDLLPQQQQQQQKFQDFPNLLTGKGLPINNLNYQNSTQFESQFNKTNHYVMANDYRQI